MDKKILEPDCKNHVKKRH